MKFLTPLAVSLGAGLALVSLAQVPASEIGRAHV